MAVGAMPQLRQIPPDRFAVLLSRGEVALGAARPVRPVAAGRGSAHRVRRGPGAALPQDAGYARGQPAPSQEGIGLAKDVWLVGAGLTLMLDFAGAAPALSRPSRNRARLPAYSGRRRDHGGGPPPASRRRAALR
ncbi:hypothetical protein V2I01_37160 [Micromonospora sp. BRA006-A]|nr:hypothetical protein [Micromonospora sp. BRA006-A]